MNPYYTTRKGKLYCGDCLEVMKELPSESIDLVITSPPYADVKNGIVSDDYVSVDLDIFVEWITEVSKEIHRLLKPTGSFVLNLNTFYNPDRSRNPYVYESVISIVKNAGLKLAQDCFWVKLDPIPSGLTTSYLRFRDGVEYLFWFAKDTMNVKTRLRSVCLEPVDTKRLERAIMKIKKNVEHRPSGHIVRSKRMYEIALERGSTPLNYICASNVVSNSEYIKFLRERGKIHPARFPEKIPEYFILGLTDVGDTILDPFFGSGTTAFVAEKYARCWIGIEISEVYCRLFTEYAELKGIGKDANLLEFE